MQRQHLSLIRMRRFALVRIAATVLLTLVLLPFTAPCSTFDLAELAGEAPLHGDLQSSSKTHKDSSAADVTLATSVIVLVAGAPVQVLAVGADTSRSMPQFVLRL
jgi:hypothetical protein